MRFASLLSRKLKIFAISGFGHADLNVVKRNPIPRLDFVGYLFAIRGFLPHCTFTTPPWAVNHERALAIARTNMKTSPIP